MQCVKNSLHHCMQGITGNDDISFACYFAQEYGQEFNQQASQYILILEHHNNMIYTSLDHDKLYSMNVLNPNIGLLAILSDSLNGS